MKLHEYQAKEILSRFGINTPSGFIATTIEEAVNAAEKLAAQGASLFVVKAQIHAGGRGKGGGVRIAKSIDEVGKTASEILGMNLVTHQTGPTGQRVRSVLITRGVDIAREYYVGITLDRQKNMNVVMVSTEGGVEIEKVANDTPEKIKKVWIDPVTGFQPFHARALALSLGLKGKSFKQALTMLTSLYNVFEETDSSLVEINPLVLSEHGDVIALDVKISLDDSALYRHRDLAELRDIHEEEPLEVEAGKHHLNYIRLDGNVGCMVNGAGLAMATMDVIKLGGGEPANFLDVGGAASAETVEAGFRIILKDKNVEAILVNIFGGIVRCDRVAKGIVDAVKKVNMKVPLIVRLQGTNAKEGQQILQESGLDVVTTILLKDAVSRVSEALSVKMEPQ